MVDFLFALIEVIRYLLRFRSYETFSQGVNLCTQILPRQGGPPSASPSATHGIRKIRDAGLPDCEDRISLSSVVLTQHWSVSDRQTDMPPVAYTMLALPCGAVYLRIDQPPLCHTVLHALWPCFSCDARVC